jgi:hypothetical protein
MPIRYSSRIKNPISIPRELMRGDDDEHVHQPDPKGVQNLPHDAPPLSGEEKGGVVASTAKRVNAWWEFSRPETMIYSECDPEAAYQDDTLEPRKCDYCAKEYRGPAVYCSLACALGDA